MKETECVRLICKDTVDDRFVDRQAVKSSIINKIMEKEKILRVRLFAPFRWMRRYLLIFSLSQEEVLTPFNETARPDDGEPFGMVDDTAVPEGFLKDLGPDGDDGLGDNADS